MTIQINTDKNISGNSELRAPLITLISDELNRFSNQITRVEVHLSDENAHKSGANDIRCLLEARIKGRKPVAVTSKSDSVDKSVAGAVEKLKKSLTSIIDRMRKH